MNILLLLLIILIVAGLLWFRSQRRKHQGKIEASMVAIEVKPTKVILSDESEPEERPARRRTGETQELRRKVVHGPYRAIDNRGEPSDVQKEKES